jgi:hypothetical protein
MNTDTPTPRTNKAFLDGYTFCKEDMMPAVAFASQLERELKAVTEQRDRLEIIAGELIAMIRMNVIGRTFEECTIEQIDKHLKPWIDDIAAVKGGQP